jgi:polysaccharide export outer membrane protein
MELTVNREGQVTFPAHGPINVSGLSFIEMKQLLTSTIKEKIIGVDVAIGIASLRSMRVFVLGDAFKPGPYTLSSLSSMTHAIFAAGGVSDIGSLRNIQLKRAGRLVSTLDLYDLLINGDSRGDLLLQSGDVVFIPPKGDNISVEGEVRRPAIYELQRNTTFKDVVTMAGGLLPTAFAKTTRVERYNQNALKNVLNLDLSNAKDLAKTVKAGDVVHIMKSAEIFSQSITVIGAVNRPGKYQWQSGRRLSDLFPSIDSHLLPSADINYGLVVREVDSARNIEVLQFDLAKALDSVTSNNNLLLKESDKIIIFSNMTKLVDDNIDLDDLAFTKESLMKKEQLLAQSKYKEKQFWSKYGTGQKTQNFTTEASKYNQTIENTVSQLKDGEQNEVNLKELTLFFSAEAFVTDH